MKQTVILHVTWRMFAKSPGTHQEICLFVRKKFRKGMLIGIFTRHNKRQLKVMLLHFFSVSESLAPRKKKSEKSTFALDGKIEPSIICYSIV